jgi:RNA polymerase sigma-70 factor, ECF subfamily
MERWKSESMDAQFVGELTAVQMQLLAYVRSLLPADPAARDVVQQANATIWTKRTDFESGTNFKAWAFSIARFEVLNYRKQQARDARLVFSDELEQTIATELADAPDDFQDRHDALQDCLRKLRHEDRELLLHRYSQARPLAEYAARVGRSVGGLKVTLHRLRSALLACIERQVRSREATA